MKRVKRYSEWEHQRHLDRKRDVFNRLSSKQQGWIPDDIAYEWDYEKQKETKDIIMFFKHAKKVK